MIYLMFNVDGKLAADRTGPRLYLTRRRMSVSPPIAGNKHAG